MLAFDTGRPVSTPDPARTAIRWPLFASEVEVAATPSICALPLRLGTIRAGWLSLCIQAGTRLSNQEFEDAITIAETITSMLLDMGNGASLEAVDQWCDQPEGNREIHQATGMIMAQIGVSAREAYMRLRARLQPPSTA